MQPRFFERNQDLVLVGALIAILLVLFAPVPTLALDLLIIINLALALSILLLTLYVERPVEFSTFPSLLLVATLYRLALNVAATRLILTGANAGDVIGSIGSFAVQGNFVIGLVVFFILVVVQYVVVTAGAQRVSEVAARFVLDSVPGQQMSIDADLNMGLIDQNEARKRRKGLEKEAAFYGAMDGASKFVKGDAVAGIIILLIDIVAGWIVGIVQMDMPWNEALSTFTLLTIGDGIVTQVPALIISVATGIIVTRSSADRQLSTEIFSQLASVPKIPVIVLVAMTMLLLLPGMPKWPILIIGLIAAATFGAARRRKAAAESLEFDQPDVEGTQPAQIRGVPPIEIRLGRDLSEHWQAMKPVLADRITAQREQQEKASGFHLPAVVFHDGTQLGRNHYEILLHGARYGHATLYPDRTLAIRGPNATEILAGIETRDPAFGLPGVWIEDGAIELARSSGYTLIDPLTVLMTHAGELFRAEAAQLLSRADVVTMLESVRSRQPGLIEELIPAILTVSDVQRVLQGLLSEEVPIRNIDQIVETLVDVGRGVKAHVELVEAVRRRLSHSICDHLRAQHEDLAVLSLDPRVEGQIADSLRRSEGRGDMILDPRAAETLIRKLGPFVEAMMQKSLNPVLLCSPEVRYHLRTFTRRSVPKLAVVSVSEVPHTIDLRSFGVISFE
jgi:flagellar biosynthesis protein FlhA